MPMGFQKPLQHEQRGHRFLNIAVHRGLPRCCDGTVFPRFHSLYQLVSLQDQARLQSQPFCSVTSRILYTRSLLLDQVNSFGVPSDFLCCPVDFDWHDVALVDRSSQTLVLDFILV